MERRETGEGKGEREKRFGLWTTITKDVPSLVQDIKAWVPLVTTGLKVITNPWIVRVAAVLTFGSMTASAFSFWRIAKAQEKRAEAEEEKAKAKADIAKTKAERAEAESKIAEAAEERARQATVAPRGGGGRD